MAEHNLPHAMVRAVAASSNHQGYMPGFGNDFETEALPFTLPRGQNSQVSTEFAAMEVPLQGGCWGSLEKKFDCALGIKA
ncbi:homogentisate 1,2-dioxygenase [Mesorhizobium comanense]|uniref:homogentisate 1,2-dioxygenase n=1 Tax=Mesorhizobium comanense TaxID=2502215 RepID=UPI0010F4999B|nr:homogentisate 1,2-dioxygenase [Mesorhizobium comanense]